MGKIKFTKNTKEVRSFLEENGFKGLSFFQGKYYIYAFLTERANINHRWIEKDYTTFDLEDMQELDYLHEEVSFEEFKKYINKITK